VTIAVSTINDAPIAQDIALQTNEDTAINVSLAASDPDQDILSYQVLSQPLQGSLTGTGSELSYTPNPNYIGTDSFTYRANDGTTDSNTATVSITILSVNDIPIAQNLSIQTAEDTAASITLVGSDNDGDALTYSIITQPSQGVLSGTAPNLSYTPNTNINGTDSFTYRVNDGQADSAIANVTITINALNDSPVAESLALQLFEDTPRIITLQGSDPDGDSLTYTLVSQPQNGVLAGSGASVTYTPNTNFNGADSFTYTVNDGQNTSNVATVSLTVDNVNDAPTVQDLNAQTAEDTAVNITFIGNDTDNDTLTYSIATQPTNGVLSGTAPNLSYTPNSNFTGSDSFTYQANDGQVDSTIATVAITVTNTNDAPVAQNITGTVNEDASVVLTLSATDADADPLTFEVTTQPQNGTLSGTGAEQTYTPSANYFGNDSFTYRASDGTASSNTAIVTLTVNPVNDEPVADNGSATTNANQALSINLIANDIDGDALTYRVTTPPQNGLITLQGAVATYTPNTNYTGTDSFTFSANDGSVESNTAMVNVTVTAIANNPPQIISTPILVSVVDQLYHYQIHVMDQDNDAVSFILNSAPNFLSLSPDGQLSGTPSPSDVGSYPISIAINDGIAIVNHEFTLRVVELPESLPANWGRDFWFIDDMQKSQVSGGANIGQMMVFITSINGAEGTIEAPAHRARSGFPVAERPPVNFSVGAGEVIGIDYFFNFYNTATFPHDEIHDRSIHVSADDDISVHVVFSYAGSSDAISLLPTVRFGQNYRLLGYEGDPVLTGITGAYSVVATEDNTTITVAAKNELWRADNSYVPPGTSYDVVLNRGEVYTLNSLTFIRSGVNQPIERMTLDQSGSRVSSDKPIGVFTTHVSSRVPTNVAYADQLSEQLPPVTHWGQRYTVVPNATRYRDLVRILADQNQTDVTINGQLVATLAEGEFWEYTLTEAQRITSNKPILVAQFATSAEFDFAERQQDNDFSLLRRGLIGRTDIDSPNYQTSYDITIDAESGQSSVIVLIPDDQIDTLLVNGNPVSASSFTNVDCGGCAYEISRSDYSIAQIALVPGNHTLSSSVAFGLYENINGLQYFADPYLAIVPPEELSQERYIFTVPEGIFARNFINLTIPTDAINSVMLDGEIIDAQYFTPVADGAMSTAQLAVNVGDHDISADAAFGLLVYGYDYNNSYGYIGGFGAPDLRPVASINVNIETLAPSIGEAFCANIQVLGPNLEPLNDIPVNVLLEGVHSENSTVFSERDGIASYCFTGYLEGQDQLTANVSGFSEARAVDWQAANGENKPPVITSSPILSVHSGDTYAYAMTAIDPESQSLTYRLINGPANIQIEASSGLVSWQPSEADIGSEIVTVTVEDPSGLVDTQSFLLTVIPQNTAPTFIDAVPDNWVTVGEIYSYQALAEDADGDRLSYRVQDGPAGMIVNWDGTVTWVPTLADVGSYSIAIAVTDTDDNRAVLNYNLTVSADPNQGPVIDTDYLPRSAKLGREFTVAVPATDPENDPLSYQLSSVLPGTATIDSQGQLSWVPDTLGTYSLSVDVQDNQGNTATVRWGVTVVDSNAALSVEIHIGPSLSIDPDEPVTVTVLPTNGAGQLIVDLTVDGQAYVLDELLQTEVTVSESGVHIVEATVSDGLETVTQQAVFFVSDPNDTESPVVSIITPENNINISSLIDVEATASDVNLYSWRLTATAGHPLAEPILLAEGSDNTGITETTVNGQFDPSMLRNGVYLLSMEATDTGGRTSAIQHVVTVEGGLKVGNFAVSFDDLAIPMGGLPLTLTRSYDSRRKHEAMDFGYGWSINYQAVTVEESVEPSRGWRQYRAQQQFDAGGNTVVLNATCIASSFAKKVTVTLPNDEVEVFDVRAVSIDGGDTSISNDDCYLLTGRYYNVVFEPQDGTDSTLTASQANSLFLNDLDGGDLVVDPSETRAAEISRYTLTTRSGFQYHLDQDFGITQIVDPNGNTLTYNETGIEHSNGKSLVFARDDRGRITTITDPAGNQLRYVYDTRGNLERMIDSTGAETTYRYNDNHGLLDVIDPLGRRTVRNIYDDTGRLIAQEDNEGNRTDFNHDLEGRLSVVSDRLGNSTQYRYDERGNVLSQVDALGNTASFTYDADDNELSQTDVLGNTTTATYSADDDQLTQTDALGNTLEYTYNSRGQETEITDARGNTFNNTYADDSNLLSVTDPQGNQAANTINGLGLVSTTTDALGHITTFIYDSNGNKRITTDPTGAEIRYDYDNNNNIVLETRNRTFMLDGTPTPGRVRTQYVYDDYNRLVQTTNALGLGRTTRTEYNAMGQAIAQIDSLGRRTEMDYDAYSNVLETRYPDGSTESHTYDAESNRLSSTDRLGRTTSFEYDALNRLVRTTYADGSSIQTEYDAAGRVVAEIDARGHRSTNEYDAANRRTATVDALGNRHEFNYDADGNLIDETDANGNTTVYTYNSLDQRTQTTFADGSSVTEAFDAMGRRISMTDQAGRTTQYGYDAVGRLTSVTDVLGQATTYTYDELGNKLTETDAAGQTTRWDYDQLGQVTRRTLPLGQEETFVYDNNGNRTQHTDFNGDTHRYAYDINDRLIQTDFADGSQETMSYDAVGNRLSASKTDSSGTRTWVYTYDSRDRLTQETKPDGSTIDYGYDAMGNKTTLSKNQGSQTIEETYQYDDLNRLSNVTAAGQVTTYGYDAVGNRSAVSYANGTVTTYTYDALNRLTNLTTDNGLGGVLQGFSYTLEPTGRRTQITETSGRVTDYTYDALYRLSEESITDTVNGNYNAQYQYDSFGNRTQSIIDGVTTVYSYDANNRITQYGGTTYTYDANGNTLTETLDGVIKTYTYNSQNEMVSVDDSLDSSAYQYNVDGIRHGKTEAGIATVYLVDHNRDYSQVLSEVENGTEVVSYTYGDDLISQNRGVATSFYHYDGLGSTRGLSDTSGALVNTYDYEAFGEVLNQSGSTLNNYLFTGEQFDVSLNQYYLRARYYNQANGRFTQMDTWQGRNHDPVTLHKYLYANSDPANFIDPSGYSSLGELGAVQQIQAILFAGFGTAAAYQLGTNIAGGSSWDDGTNVGPGSTGWLILAAMVSTNGNILSKFADRINEDDSSTYTLYHGTDIATARLLGGGGPIEIDSCNWRVSCGGFYLADQLGDAEHFAVFTQSGVRDGGVVQYTFNASAYLTIKGIATIQPLQSAPFFNPLGNEIIVPPSGFSVFNGLMLKGDIKPGAVR